MTSPLKTSSVERLLPEPLRSRLRLMRHRHSARVECRPLAELFHDIYEQGLWGRIDGQRYCSGDAALEQSSRGYEDYVTQYLWRTPAIKTVVDIGCGDFQVAQRILARVGRPIRYVGCDIAANVIDHNTASYGELGAIEFVCMDATRDQPPDGDLVLVREVFQHLSNAHVQAVIANLRSRYDHAIVADCVTKRSARLNVDIASGDRRRTALRSGVYLEATPFNLTVLDRRQEAVSARIAARTLLIEF